MGEVKSIYSIIKAPLTTEKTTRLSPFRKYSFCVLRGANKIDIKKAVEKIYNVKVERVASMVVKGKMKKVRANQPGRTSAWKKAMVTLKKGFEIKIT